MKPTRREFIAAAAVPALSPLLLHMQDKAGTKAPVLGQGAFTYEAIHDWGQLPAQIKWGNTHGVVEDSQGNIYVHHTVHSTSETPDSMVVFDRSGKFVRSWGKEFRGVAHGLHIRKEGSTEFLYLTVNSVAPNAANPPEIQGALVKATLKGEIVWRIQGPPDIEQYRPAPPPAAPRRYNPTNIAVAPNGDVYVADGYGFYYINQYNSKGEYIRTFGGRAPGGPTGPDAPLGTLAEPHGIWMDTRSSSPILVVADRRNARLQRFTLDGKPVDTISGYLRLPCHFHEHHGNVVIPDLQGRVTLMDKNNALIAHLGDSNAANWNSPLRTQPREQFTPGVFVQPHGATFDHEGNIFVVEWVEVGRVTKLRKVS
jgi:hypothetical protein